MRAVMEAGTLLHACGPGTGEVLTDRIISVVISTYLADSNFMVLVLCV
jgi:hypothetical protein